MYRYSGLDPVMLDASQRRVNLTEWLAEEQPLHAADCASPRDSAIRVSHSDLARLYSGLVDKAMHAMFA